MTAPTAVLVSLSAAMDGGLTGIADVSTMMAAAGAADDYRLIGGVAVMLHVQRLGLHLPLRATGDADVGIPPHVLRRPRLLEAIEALDYRKVAGNRWEIRGAPPLNVGFAEVGLRHSEICGVGGASGPMPTPPVLRGVLDLAA